MNNPCSVDAITLIGEDMQIHRRRGGAEVRGGVIDWMQSDQAAHRSIASSDLRVSAHPVNAFNLSSNKLVRRQTIKKNAVGIKLRIVPLWSIQLSVFPSVTTRTPSRYQSTRVFA